MKMASNLVSIFGVNGQLLLSHTSSHQGQTFKVINPDTFATDFGECMCTFIQEKRALNHVRIVS